MGELGGLAGFVAGWSGNSSHHHPLSRGWWFYEPTVLFGKQFYLKYRVGFI